MTDSRPDGPTDAQSDAEKYRLEQAAQLMRDNGFIECADGTWVRRPRGNPRSK